METQKFLTLVQGVRAGDDQACTELVRDYGPYVMRVARNRLGCSAVRAILDADDIHQSVMRSFFRRASDDQYVLTEPSQLIRLLTAMTRNKTVDKVRIHSKSKSSITMDSEQRIGEVADVVLGPAAIAAHRDDVAHVVNRLNNAEKQLFELRLEGYSWREIAARLQQNADALRKRLSRSLRLLDFDPHALAGAFQSQTTVEPAADPGQV